MAAGAVRIFIGAAVAAGCVTLAPSPAHADPVTGLTADVELDWSTSPSSGTCTTAYTGTVNQNAPVPADGQPHTATITATVTAIRTPGNTMTGTVTETRTITAMAVAGELAHVVVQDSWTASFQAVGAGAECNLRLFTHGDTAGRFTLSHPSWVRLTATGHRVQEVASVANDGTPVPSGGVAFVAVAGGGASNTVGAAQGLVPPPPPGGTLVVVPSEDGDVWAPTATRPETSASGSGTVDIRLDAPGTATGPASGSGRKYVGLPEGQDCVAHSATATWATKAGRGRGKDARVVKATFKVGRATVGKAHHPTKGRKTALKGLPAVGPVEVVGTLLLKSGRTLTVSRSYLPCG